MDDLQQRLDQILNDPEQMNMLLRTAQTLGLSTGNGDPLSAPEATGQFAAMMQQARQKDEKQQALIHALLPYLRPGKQRRLERAMQVAQLSHLAGYALRGQWKEDGLV